MIMPHDYAELVTFVAIGILCMDNMRNGKATTMESWEQATEEEHAKYVDAANRKVRDAIMSIVRKPN